MVLSGEAVAEFGYGVLAVVEEAGAEAYGGDFACEQGVCDFLAPDAEYAHEFCGGDIRGGLGVCEFGQDDCAEAGQVCAGDECLACALFVQLAEYAALCCVHGVLKRFFGRGVPGFKTPPARRT